MADATVRNNKITIRKSREADFPTNGLSAGEFAFSYPTGTLYMGNSAENGVIDLGGARLNSTISALVGGYNLFDSAIDVSTAGADKKGVDLSGITAGLTLAAGLQMQKTPVAGTDNLEIATTEFVNAAVAASTSGVVKVEGITGEIDLVPGTGLGISAAAAAGGLDPSITITGLTAGTDADNIGMAAFNTNTFSIANTGVVNVKTGGISNTQLANSTYSVNVPAQTHGAASIGNVDDVVTLGEGITFAGTDNEIQIDTSTVGDGPKLTFGLPNTVNLTHGITAPNINSTLATITDLNVSAGVTIGGDLTVNGTITTISTTNLEIEDAFVELSNDVGNTDQDFGLFSQIGASNWTGLAYDSSTSRYYLFESGSFDGSNAVVTTETGGNMAQFRANLNGCLVDGGGF